MPVENSGERGLAGSRGADDTEGLTGHHLQGEHAQARLLLFRREDRDLVDVEHRARARQCGVLAVFRCAGEKFLETFPAEPGALDHRPAADRLFDRREGTAEKDRSGDHRAGGQLALQHEIGTEAEHGGLQEETEGLGGGGELAHPVARGDLGGDGAAAHLLPTLHRGAAHAERLDHFALLAHHLGISVALKGGSVGFCLRLAGENLVQERHGDEDKRADEGEMAEPGMKGVDGEDEDRRPGHVEHGEEHR